MSRTKLDRVYNIINSVKHIKNTKYMVTAGVLPLPLLYAIVLIVIVWGT